MARPRFGRRRLAAETLYAVREIGAPGNANLLIGRSPQQETTTKARARSRHLSPDTRPWNAGWETRAPIFQNLKFHWHTSHSSPFASASSEQAVGSAFGTSLRTATVAFSTLEAPSERSEEHTSELQSRGHLVC